MATKKHNGASSKHNAVDAEVTEPVTESPEPEVPGLDLRDLAVSLQLIEFAIQRGTYKPNELATVGETHSRIQAFLEHQAKLQSAAKANETQGEA